VPKGWTAIGHYPDDVYDNVAATDPATGDVYSVGGAGLAEAFQYRPATQTWTQLPDMQYQRGAAVATVIAGKLYVTGGWDLSESTPDGEAVMRPELEIYDPQTGQWSMGARIPHAFYGSSAATLNGDMYVVGGCKIVGTSDECTSRDVQVYDPASNTWTQAAPYPTGTGYLGCGAISGKLYCAGGLDQATGGAITSAYSYDPASNTWSPIASLPISLWGGGHAAANGQLLMSGGVTGPSETSTAVTDKGYSYDPAANAWTPLAPSGDLTYRGGSACGLYRIGGFGPSNIYGDTAEQLTGYGDCDGGAGVPWLKDSPAQATLAPGQSTTVTLTMNAADASITQPGRYTATLQLDGNTPYVPQQAGVTLTASPPPAWGGLAGTISGRSCGGKTAPLAGVTIAVDSAAGSWTLTTGRHGRYGTWLDSADSPLTLIVTQSGWLAQTKTVKITAGKTTTADFTLRRNSCA
jgi:N-acetylneuraminic acid mutarotase